MLLLQNQHLKGSDMASSESLDVRWANDDPNPKAVRRVKRQCEEEYMSAVREAVNELPPEQKRARLLEMQLYGNVQPNSAVAPYPGAAPDSCPVGIFCLSCYLQQHQAEPVLHNQSTCLFR